MASKAVWGRWVILALLLLVIAAPARAQYIAPGFGATPAGAMLNSTRLSADYQITQADLALYRWMPAQAVCPACFYGMRPIDGSYASMLWDGNRLYRLSSPVKIAITAGMSGLLGYTIFRNKWGLIGGAIAGGVTQLLINRHQRKAEEALRAAYLRSRQQTQAVTPQPTSQSAPSVASQLPDGTVIAMPNGATQVVHGNQLVVAPPSQGATIRQPPVACDASQSMIWFINESDDWPYLAGISSKWLQDPNNHTNYRSMAVGNTTELVVRVPPRGRLCIPLPEEGERYKVGIQTMAVSLVDGSLETMSVPEEWRDITIAARDRAFIFRGIAR